MPVILVAPAAFKGTLGPRQVAEAFATGVRRAIPGAAVLECPVADGGDGVLDVGPPPPGGPRERLDLPRPIGGLGPPPNGWGRWRTAVLPRPAGHRACALVRRGT